jgi:hypothetical protein
MHKMTYYFPRAGSGRDDIIRSEVYCYDAAGRPMVAVAVKFTWPLASGPKSMTTYTDANGLAYDWQAPGSSIRLMEKRTVVAGTIQSGQLTRSTTWFMPTPMLASGSSGMKTTMSDTSGSTVTAKTRVRDRSGRPVAGLPITYYWSLRSGTAKTTATTNSRGYAYSSKNVGSSARRLIVVRTKAYAGRHERNSSTSFVAR